MLCVVQGLSFRLGHILIGLNLQYPINVLPISLFVGWNIVKHFVPYSFEQFLLIKPGSNVYL